MKIVDSGLDLLSYCALHIHNSSTGFLSQASATTGSCVDWRSFGPHSGEHAQSLHAWALAVFRGRAFLGWIGVMKKRTTQVNVCFRERHLCHVYTLCLLCSETRCGALDLTRLWSSALN